MDTRKDTSRKNFIGGYIVMTIRRRPGQNTRTLLLWRQVDGSYTWTYGNRRANPAGWLVPAEELYVHLQNTPRLLAVAGYVDMDAMLDGDVPDDSKFHTVLLVRTGIPLVTQEYLVMKVTDPNTLYAFVEWMRI